MSAITDDYSLFNLSLFKKTYFIHSYFNESNQILLIPIL